jgi:sugar lactone lactonase YvrE
VRTFHARPVSGDRHELAEGPLWDPVRARLLWVDIQAGAVLAGELLDGQVRRTATHHVDDTVGAVVPADDGRLLVAGHQELLVTDAEGAVRDRLRVVPADLDSRLNDGGCDPAGRFLVGTMALDDREGGERLCRLEADGSLTVLDDDLTVSNGLAWSPDGTRLYSVDSGPGDVWVRSYDVATGAVGQRTRLLRIDEGTPDGMCADADGNLWIALFAAGEVRCYAPAGDHLATVHVDAPNPTSVAFVGPHLDRLLITTAQHELSDEERADHPDAGRLFLVDVGVDGLPVARWDGVWSG